MTLQWTEGDVIRKLRSVVGLTLTQLAAVSGVNLQVIHRLEAGTTKEPKRATRARLAAAFGLTERHLLDAVPPAIDIPVLVKFPREAPPAKRKRPLPHAPAKPYQRGHRAS